jgi:hypothetical protein
MPGEELIIFSGQKIINGLKNAAVVPAAFL